MKEYRIPIRVRVLAVILAVALLVGMMPNSTLMVHADGGTTTYYIEVLDAENHPVKEATVEWIQYAVATVTPSEATPSEATPGEVTPSEMNNGTAEWDETEEKYKLSGLDVVGIENIYLSVTVWHDDYKTQTKNIIVNSSNPKGRISVTSKTEDGSFRFVDRNSTIEYAENGTYTRAIANGVENVTYKIMASKNADGTEAEGIATIDESSGTLNLLKPGKVTVKAFNDEYYATYELTIEKKNRTIFFAQSEINITYDGATLAAGQTIQQSNIQNVTYTITPDSEGITNARGESATVNSSTGAITFPSDDYSGSITIEACAAETETEKECMATYTYTVKPQEVSLKFENPKETYKYGRKSIALQEITLTKDDNAVKQYITYKIESQTTETGEPTSDLAVIEGNSIILKEDMLGTIVIQAKLEGSKGYVQASAAEYTIIIEKAEQGLEFADENIDVTWDDERWNSDDSLNITNALSQGPGSSYSGEMYGSGYDTTGEVTYSISPKDEGVSIETSSGVITITNRKEHIKTYTITATINASKLYEAKTAEYKLNIGKAKPEIEFLDPTKKEKIEVVSWKYGEKESYQAQLKLPDDIGENVKVKYSFADDSVPAGASINATTGEVTFTDEFIGSVKVLAHVEETEYYTASDAEYTITVNQQTQRVQMVQSYQAIYGKDKYLTLSPKVLIGDSDSELSGATVVYEIVSGGDWIANPVVDGKVQFEGNQAKLKFKNKAIGTIEFKVYAEGNDYYTESDKSVCTIAIGHSEFDSSDIEIEDITFGAIKAGNQTKWYNHQITIEAPDGFLISDDMAWYEENGTNQDKWSASLTYNTEKKPPEVYLQEKSTGAISDKITLNKVEIDVTAPIGSITKNISGKVKNQNQTIQIELTDNLSGINASTIQLDCTATDLAGKTLNTAEPSVSWDGTTVTIQFTVDAKYNINKLFCKDNAGNQLEQNIDKQFTLDKTAPKTGDMSIAYSTELNKWEEVLDKVTFGYYSYQKGTTVTLTAKDNLSGITSLEWKYAQEKDTSTTNNVKDTSGKITKLTVNKDGSVSGTFTLTASKAKQYRGKITFTATDAAGNVSGTKKENNVVIVDNISPTRTVTLTPAIQEVDNVLYYDDTVKATFTITEANFYASDVKITVDGSQKTVKSWKQDGDTWTGTIKISGEGEHQLRMTYKDRSNNKMTSYAAKKIVIDTKAPVISVSYQDGVEGANNTNYYAQAKTATITITETNFDASGVVASVTAKDSSGNDVSIMDYASYLSKEKNWERSGNKWIATISYTADANYTFDIDYTDYVGHAAADYKADAFTVDKTAPSELSVSYSTGVLERILNAVTFGYYNEKVVVTISAKDDTSGIEHFGYSYQREDGVSEVNAEKLNAVIQKAAISQNGSVFTATFTIPEDVLSNTTQFNGTVGFAAYDYASNQTEMNDNRHIIVDNIKPVADVTIPDPVNSVDGVSYYAGNIEVAVTIQEANFDAEDVVLAVTKDGAAVGTPVNWTDNGVDVHIGTFNLQEDGDYTFTVDYTDKSENVMDQYVSGQLTIDTEIPTVSVSNIKNNSANKDETYSFTITASDVNFDTASFHPVLSAVVMDEQGHYATQELDLGTMRAAGDNYSYSVENLEADAVYSLSCEVSDLAGNTCSKVLLTDDGNEEYDTVKFSVNRNGSTYELEEDAKKIVDQYYVYDVGSDVVIDEINVDTVNDYAVSVNGETLTEGTDYTTEVTSKDGEWSKRSYILKSSLFEAEGEYNVVVESTDKTNTTSYSDVKNLNVAFVVDQTAPVLTVSGLKEDGRYQVEEQTVTVIPTDDGGKLNSLKAVVSDSDGSNEEVRFEMSGEEFETYLAENSGTVTFTIPEGVNRKVEIVCNDQALHADGTTNERREEFTKITVSPSGFVMLYANKLLLYSIIGGMVAIILLSGAGVIFIRRKKVRKVK